MQDRNVIEKLIKKEGFTSAESSLADYIIHHIDDVYGMSLQDLAKASYVSKPSVIRLYRKIGCQSYREFSISLQLEKIKTDGSNAIENSGALIGSGSFGEYVRNIGMLSKQIVGNCVESIDKSGLEDIIRILNDANRIFAYADGDIITEVRSFNNRMKQIGIEATIINDSDDPDALVASITEEDAAVIISASGEREEEDERIIRKIHGTSALKILVTTWDDPKRDYDADYSLYTYPNGNEFIRGNLFISQMSLLMGMNMIMACLYKVRMEK